MSVDLRKLEHFVAVAEELNFTRAAARLHMSQQALSTSIRSFERELGCTLFERDRRQVVLMPAGVTLLRDAPWLLAVAASLAERVREVGTTSGPVLKVGHTPAVTSEEAFACLRHTREQHKGASIVVAQHFTGKLADGLYDGGVDVALSRAAIGTAAPDRLESVRITDQRLRIAMAADHRLAGSDALRLDDLRDETFVLWAEPGSSAYSDLLLEECRRVGFTPRTVVTPMQGTRRSRPSPDPATLRSSRRPRGLRCPVPSLSSMPSRRSEPRSSRPGSPGLRIRCATRSWAMLSELCNRRWRTASGR